MENQTEEQKLIHNLNSKASANTFRPLTFVVILIGAIAIGIGTGYFLTKYNTNSTSGNSTKTTAKSAGITDKKTFKDKAEGKLRPGGIDGEGSFHLERPGGESQNVYLTSTTLDLSKFVGKKVRVWGETFQAEKAGWLMDVGLLEVIQ